MSGGAPWMHLAVGERDQGVANLAWAFVNAGHLDPQLFAALASAAEQRLDEFSQLDGAERDNAEWAFARAGQHETVKRLRQRKKK